MKITKLALAVALLVATPAFGVFFEIEGGGGNGTLATAQSLIPTALPVIGAEVGLSSLAAGGGDVDMYSYPLAVGDVLTAVVTPTAGAGGQFFGVPDTCVGVFNPGGTLLVVDDDGGTDSPNPASSFGGGTIRVLATTPGVFTIAVSAFSDGCPPTGGDTIPFNGLGAGGIPHTTVGSYLLTVSVIPEPGTLALIGLGALALIRRRR